LENKLIENIHYYFNDEGLMVFTNTYHLERGYCCGNGCLHCPYNYDAVLQPLKSKLLDEKKKNNDSKNKSG